MTNPEALDSGIELYRSLIAEDDDLQAEFESTDQEFFHRAAPTVEASPEAALASRRHLEWFLIERPSVHLRRPPVEALEERWSERAAPDERPYAAAYKNSIASVFEVTGVRRGKGLWLRDLAGYGEYPVEEPEASALIEEGDLVVGRLFPLGESTFHVSRAAGFFRNPELVEALRHDLDRARESRRGVLRIAQSDLEAMFWSPRSEVLPRVSQAPSDPVGELRRLLLSSGVEREEVDAILAELAAAPFDPERLLFGSGDVLGAILDRLAFDTTIDLDRAREALIHAWSELAAPGAHPMTHTGTPAEVDPPVDVARAMEAFDRGRAEGGDLERLFGTLEHDLALDTEPDPLEEDDESPVPDFPGVVGAMVEEFLWETGREQGEAAARELVCLRSFGQYGQSLGVFENLRLHDLLVFTCYWLPESGELENADQAQAMLAALQRFCRWAEEKHEVPLYTDSRPALERLRSSLPRVVEANRRRTREADKSRGEVYELLPGTPGETVRLRDRKGHEVEARLDPWLGKWLLSGDRLRANLLDDGRLAVYCCYPPELAELESEV